MESSHLFIQVDLIPVGTC